MKDEIMALPQRLRDAVQKLRRTPMPIADVAPMLTQAADALEKLEQEHVQRLLRIEQEVEKLVAENAELKDHLSTIRNQGAELESAKKDAQRKDEALLNIARKAEMLKRECGDDPESPQAIRNGRYMHLSYLARAAIKGVSE